MYIFDCLGLNKGTESTNKGKTTKARFTTIATKENKTIQPYQSNNTEKAI